MLEINTPRFLYSYSRKFVSATELSTIIQEQLSRGVLQKNYSKKYKKIGNKTYLVGFWDLIAFSFRKKELYDYHADAYNYVVTFLPGTRQHVCLRKNNVKMGNHC